MVKGVATIVSFFYKDLNGQPISGAQLSSWIRKNAGSWTVTNFSPTETAPAMAPGVYDLVLTSEEMNADLVDWYARSNTGVFAGQGRIEPTEDWQTLEQTVFNAVFTEADTEADRAIQCAFLDRLADHVLRRSQASAETSLHGDSVGAASLLGVTAVLTQGQLVATGCNGESYIFLNSARQGQPPIGALRVVKNGAGTPIGVLPLSGPNAVADATQNCECP